MDWLLGTVVVLDSGLLQGLMHSVLALSVVVTLLSLDFPDLTIEGSFPFGAAVAAVLLAQAHLHPVLALGVVFLAGAGAGTLTGILHVRFGMSKLLAGISVAAMLYSGALLVMGGRANIPLLEATTLLSPFEAIDGWVTAKLGGGSSHFYLHAGSLLAALAVAIPLLLATNRLLVSEFGVVLRAVGINEPALRHYRRSSARFKIAGVAIGNGLAAFGGGMFAQYQGFADVNMGIGVLVSSLVSVILGHEIFSRLRITMTRPARVTIAAVLGAIVYQLLMAAILAAGAPPTALRFLSGLMLVLAVVLRARRAELSFRW